MILIHQVANLVVRCEPTPLDGQGVAAELSAGRSLWTPEFGPGLIPKALKPARPGAAKLLREHRCAAVSGPGTPPAVPAPPKASPGPVQSRVAPSTPYSARSTVRSGARAADRLPSRPTCSACSQPMADGTYASIEVGQLVIWAQHVEECTG